MGRGGKFGARVIKERWRPSTGAGGTEPAPSPGEVPLAHCPQEELGGLLGGAGREQPRLLQGAQGPGTRHLGELGARRSWGGSWGAAKAMGGTGGRWGQQGWGLWRRRVPLTPPALQCPASSRPESSVDLRGAALDWARHLSSKKNVIHVSAAGP